MSNEYIRHDAMTTEEALVDEMRTALSEHPERGAVALGFMLDQLAEALDEDMEQGAAWMNDAAHAEFVRKYPRFTTLLRVARHVDWAALLISSK